MYLMFFRLQAEGGPTYLTQIGYVAAAVGAGIGVGVLGESLSGGRLGGHCGGGGGHRADDAGPMRTARAWKLPRFLHWHRENPSAIDPAQCEPGALAAARAW